MAARQEEAPERTPADGPDAPAGHSGRLLVRMPATLHAELARVARREGVSLNALVVGALSGAVGWRSPERGAPAGEQVAAAPPAAVAPHAPAAPAAVAPHAPAAPAVVAPQGPAVPPAGATRSRTLSVALAVNLVVVLLAAAAAIGLVIAAWPS